MSCSTTSSPYSYPSLESEVMPQWSQIAKEIPHKSMHLEAPRKEIKRAFEAYENAYKGSLSLVILGEASIREETDLLKNFGALATDSQLNQKVMKAFFKSSLGCDANDKELNKMVKAHVSQGAIMYDSNWWPFRNDLFMLGAIHAGKEFHLASKPGVPKDEVLWDKENQRPRVLGRELIMLALAGYSKSTTGDASKLGIVFAPPCDKGIRMVTLTQCRKKISEIKGVDEIKNIFNSTRGGVVSTK